jgi:hypothetical protein
MMKLRTTCPCCRHTFALREGGGDALREVECPLCDETMLVDGDGRVVGDLDEEPPFEVN